MKRRGFLIGMFATGLVAVAPTISWARNVKAEWAVERTADFIRKFSDNMSMRINSPLYRVAYKVMLSSYLEQNPHLDDFLVICDETNNVEMASDPQLAKEYPSWFVSDTIVEPRGSNQTYQIRMKALRYSREPVSIEITRKT